MNDLKIIEKFYDLSNHAYEAWITYRTMFDDNSRRDKFLKTQGAMFWIRFNLILIDYVLLQIAKLHDPGQNHSGQSLTIDYVTNHLSWNKATHQTLRDIKSELDKLLGKLIKPARNKILCHNDLKIIMKDAPLSGFTKDNDIIYFNKLQEFTDIVYSESFNVTKPFNHLAKQQAIDFLSTIK